MKKSLRYFENDKDGKTQDKKSFEISLKSEASIDGLCKIGTAGNDCIGKITGKRSFPSKRRKISPDPFTNEAPISDESIRKYDLGVAEFHPERAKTEFARKKFEKKRRNCLIEVDNLPGRKFFSTSNKENGELLANIRQKDISNAVDISSATKHFELDLSKFGPYRFDYTKNGRHLVIGGKRGHVASFDWMTKKMHCETNVMEGVRDVQWLHVETMFAVAQKKWTYIYDNMGVELHCIKQLNDIKRLEFLPYHFLLVAGSNTSYLHWVDISLGEIVASFPTKLGSLDVLTRNNSNAIIHCGHPNGVVSLWSPNIKEPLVRILAHPCSIKAIAVDNAGIYMATTGMDRKIRIWDLRKYQQIHSYKLPNGLSHVAFSQNRILAVGVGNSIQLLKDAHLGRSNSLYLTHECSGTVTDLKFCPYEDVLGVGHQNGFASLIVPGAGEPNFDALEANPYQSKKHRQEHEIKSLLDKIQPEMISLDAGEIAKVDVDQLDSNLVKKAKILYLKSDKIHFTPRHKMKGRGSSLKKQQRKQGVLEEKRRVVSNTRREAEKELFGAKKKREQGEKSVLDRFNRRET